jgi:hypothetical protein
MKLKKTRILLLLVAALTFAFATAATPPAAHALVCPEGSTLEFGVNYYTTAAKTVLFCQNYACGGGTCNGQTTPYFSLTRECCLN